MGSLYENSTIYDDDDDHHHDLISTLDNNYHHYYQQNDEHHHHRRHHQKQQQQATYSSSSSGRSQHHHHHTRTTRTWKIHVFSQRWSNISILLLLLSLTLTLQVTISSCSPLRGNEANFYPRSYLQHHQNRFQRHLKPSNMLQDNLGENTFVSLQQLLLHNFFHIFSFDLTN